MIYFIRCSSTGLVKIGKSHDVQKRYKALQCASASDLVLEATADGYTKVEHYLHTRCAERRVKGEWFRLDADEVTKLVEFISESQRMWTHNHKECQIVREALVADSDEIASLPARAENKRLLKRLLRAESESEQSERFGPSGFRRAWKL